MDPTTYSVKTGRFLVMKRTANWQVHRFRKDILIMKPIFARALPAVALMTSMTGAFANPIVGNGIESIDLDLGQTVYEIRVHNASQSTALSNLSLAVKTNSLSIPAQGSVKCSKGNSFAAAKIGYGVFNPTFYDSNVLHHENFPLTAWEWEPGIHGAWVGEAMDQNYAYTLPVGSMKDPAKPELQVDPLAEVAKMRDAYIQNGGTELGFYRNAHEVSLQRKVSAIASCMVSQNETSSATFWKPITVKVIYEADPDLANFQLNANLLQGGVLANGINQDLPMDVSSAELLPYSPNFVGQCPVDLKFRVDITGSGNGSLKYRIVEGSGTVHQSETHDYEGGNGVWKHDFVYPIEWEGQESLEKTDRTFKLYVAHKDEDEFGVPTMYNLYDQVNWSHKCTPKVNINLGGTGPNGGLVINQGDNGNGGDTPLGFSQGASQSNQNAAPSAVFVPASPSKPGRAATPAEPQTREPARATAPTETRPERASTTAPARPERALTAEPLELDSTTGRPARSSTR